MELKEQGNLREEEWVSIDSLMNRMNDLASLSQRISSSVIRVESPYTQDEETSELPVSLNVENASRMKWSINPESVKP